MKMGSVFRMEQRLQKHSATFFENAVNKLRIKEMMLNSVMSQCYQPIQLT